MPGWQKLSQYSGADGDCTETTLEAWLDAARSHFLGWGA